MYARNELPEPAGKFWRAFKEAIHDMVIDVGGELREFKDDRSVRFYDTADYRLYHNGYIFRERIDRNEKERELTLKFRHPDRYVSEDREMVASKEKAKTKFEEDIKAPFVTFYSYSSQLQTSKSPSQGMDLRGLTTIFPGLGEHVPFVGEERLVLVRNFAANEVVIAGADFQIRNSPKIEAECALIVWYDSSGPQNEPVAVEFSFRYGNEKGDYGLRPAQRAYNVFSALGKDLDEWVDTKGPTKTRFVYSDVVDAED